MSGNMSEIVLDLKETLHASNVPKFVTYWLLTALERDGATRKTIGTVFNEMLKLRYFILDDILEG